MAAVVTSRRDKMKYTNTHTHDYLFFVPVFRFTSFIFFWRFHLLSLSHPSLAVGMAMALFTRKNTGARVTL